MYHNLYALLFLSLAMRYHRLEWLFWHFAEFLIDTDWLECGPRARSGMKMP